MRSWFQKARQTIDTLGAARELAAHHAMLPEQLASYQRQELGRLVRHAVSTSPFYRRHLGGCALDGEVAPGDLPTLDKQTMLQHFDDLVTDRRLRLADLERHLQVVEGDGLYLGEYRVLATGGMSGARGVFVYGRRDWRYVLGGLVRHAKYVMHQGPRFPVRRRLATVAAGSPQHMTARAAASLDVGMYSLLRLDARSPMAELRAALQSFQPDSLAAYASSAALLADEQLAGRLSIHPTTVQTTSEVRTPEMATRIHEAWDCQLFNLYATTETGLLGVECDTAHGLHVVADQTILEVVDEQDQPVPPGEPGARVLVTNLYNRTQPLIRYRLDDLVTISPEPCACGLPFPLIASLDGRSDDILQMVGVDGNAVTIHPLVLRSPLSKISILRQYRIIHDTAGLTVEAVAMDRDSTAELDGRIRQAIKAALEEAGVRPTRVEVRPVDEIPRHAGTGKTRLIESRIQRSASR